MKSIEFPFNLVKNKTSNSTLQINKKSFYYSLLIASGITGFFLPGFFIAFGLLLVTGIIIYCLTLFKEISEMDFESEKYSITLEEIIEDLEG